MIKRGCSLLLAGMLLLMLMPSVSAESGDRKTAEAAYGTPVTDGETDEVWSRSNPYVINRVKGETGESYKGWFKALWDENCLYILAKIYGDGYSDTDSLPQNQDSIEIFIDEAWDRTTSYHHDDYRLYTNFDGVISGTNYDVSKMICQTRLFGGGYTVEMAIPFKTVIPRDGLSIGLDVQVNAAQTPKSSVASYGWSSLETGLSQNNASIGTLNLKETVSIMSFEEPVYQGPSPDGSEQYIRLEDVTTVFDGKEFHYPIVLTNEYPCMEIGDLAAVIGGSAEGDTLIKDDVRLSFTQGSRLAEDGKGHIMLERSPSIHNGGLYVPVSVLMVTLCYHVQYRRFDNRLEITSGTNYPQEAEVVLYAHDYGAVGDGVHDDGRAITCAIYAALSSGKPSRVELDKGKTYLVGERIDNWNYFVIEDGENFTLEGNGSDLLFEKPVNTFIQIMRSKNIKIKNLTVDYMELPFSQGRILSVNQEAGNFQLQIDEGYPLPADDQWVKHYNTDPRSGGWWFGQIMDPAEDHMKYTGIDHLYIESIRMLEERICEVTVRNGQAYGLSYAEAGDRFVLNTRHSAYDLDAKAKSGSTSAIYVANSADIEFDGVYIYSTPWMLAGLGFNDGRIVFRNSGNKIKPDSGRLLAGNSDGIHCWNNRCGIVVENCTFMNTLDDFINTYNIGGRTTRRLDKHTFEIHQDNNLRIGDEMLFYDQVNKKVLGTAYLTDCQPGSEGRRILTMDRDIEGVISNEDGTEQPSLIYNLDSCSRGNVVRGNTFAYSRRHAFICRTPNTIFEDNTVIGCGGSAMAAMNELTETKSEGPFPSSHTLRNNRIEGAGNTDGYYPVQIMSWEALPDSTVAIDGVLMEGNEIDVPNELGAVSINAVKDLYMLNNTLKCDKPLKSTTKPVAVSNSHIALIDGLEFSYLQDVCAAVTIVGSKVKEKNIKNINIAQPNSTKPYVVLEREHVTEAFTDAEGQTFPNDFMSIPTYNRAATEVAYPYPEGWAGDKALSLTRIGEGNQNGYADMVLTLNVTDKVFLSQKRGRLNYEFDCYIPHWRGIRLESVSSGKVTDVLRIDNSTEDDVGNILAREGDRLGDIRYDQWNKVKVVFDYANSAAEYYLNSEYIGARSFQDYENMDTEALRYMRIVSFAPQNTILYFDNFNIWYEEYPNVSQIRYVDSRGRETAGEEVSADLAEIRIEFNCSMDVESLDKAVMLENSDGAELFSGSFDEASNTYTLKPTNGKKYFLPNTDYTLTIDTSAASGGISLRSPVIYCFHTGQGVVRIDQFDVKNMDGTAINAAKISGKEVKVIAQALNSYEEGKNIQMILCGYKENLLTYMQSWKVPLRMGETYISKKFQVEENAEIDAVKAFVWDSVGRALPLRECVVVTK